MTVGKRVCVTDGGCDCGEVGVTAGRRGGGGGCDCGAGEERGWV